MGWQMWLAGGLALLVVLVLVIARLGEGGDSHTTHDRRPGNSAAQAGDDSVVAPSTTPTAAPAAAVSNAKQFMRAWLRPNASVSEHAWWATVSKYTDAGLSDQLKLTDPARVPAQELRGEPNTQSVSDNRVVLNFNTDAGVVAVTSVLLGDGPTSEWRVSDVDSDVEAQG
jgi:hypothetical protein